jgi:hypothetical protein
MRKLMREWGFPAGLGLLWVIAVVYTLNSVSGLPLGHKHPSKAVAPIADPAARS